MNQMQKQMGDAKVREDAVNELLLNEYQQLSDQVGMEYAKWDSIATAIEGSMLTLYAICSVVS